MMTIRWIIATAALTGASATWAAAPARFTTEDGVEIVGDFHAAPGAKAAPVVVLLHMYRSDHSAWAPLVPHLGEAGFAVLAIDMRGHGQSISPSSARLRERVMGRDPALFNAMDKDVAAAYRWLSKQHNVDLSQFSIVGASVGCSVALTYAARDRSVDAVVCMTPGKRYLGVDSVADMRGLRNRAVLLLATEDEREAADALGRLQPGAEARIVGPGQIHGTHMFGKIDGIEDRIVAFLKEHVVSPEATPVAAAVDGTEYFAVGSARDIDLDPKKRRLFSSVEEARARGLSGPDSPLDGRMIDTIDTPIVPGESFPDRREPPPGSDSE